MVSTATIISMFVPIVVCIGLFVGLILVYRKKTGIAVKPVVIGALGFVIATQILEKVLHVVVITNFPNYADHPWLFGLYGGMAAGLFEEPARFLLFIWLLKKFHDYKGGISFGIGWGGIEAVLLVLMTVVPNLIFAFMINSGTFESSLAGSIPADQLAGMKETIVNQGVSFYLLGSLERFFAVFLQIAFSLFVLLAVVKKKFSYVVYAILIHAAIDFPLAFYQTGHLKNLWVIEIYMAIIGLLSFVFIKKARSILPHTTR
ncbi:YhfC family intramembrane metalloprotease [Neobacillus sp. MER 74]|uniref:YhfC family intramembrane metalloprotease n=1 Tax=unclassified Neobacillus TaxID=2675272 RepID=UPI0020414C03|nr:YhfC family glutamic-type intramembrane protease [Neobacillus sp. MER 74]MCM3117698.1 YhfC family intramembrane metalloprotease [Neobacillus sp. MER 74]